MTSKPVLKLKANLALPGLRNALCRAGCPGQAAQSRGALAGLPGLGSPKRPPRGALPRGGGDRGNPERGSARCGSRAGCGSGGRQPCAPGTQCALRSGARRVGFSLFLRMGWGQKSVPDESLWLARDTTSKSFQSDSSFFVGFRTQTFYVVLSDFSLENSLRTAICINRRGHDAVSSERCTYSFPLEVSFVAVLGFR